MTNDDRDVCGLWVVDVCAGAIRGRYPCLNPVLTVSVRLTQTFWRRRHTPTRNGSRLLLGDFLSPHAGACLPYYREGREIVTKHIHTALWET